MVRLAYNLSQEHEDSSWRQYVFNLKKLKILYRKAQKIKHSSSKDPKKQKERQKLVVEAYEQYLEFALRLISKTESTLSLDSIKDLKDSFTVLQTRRFLLHAIRQADQIHRRVIKGEVIAHEEKVFSIFQEHTEWINKGKAGGVIELGLKVCVIEDQHGFLLHHHVMQKENDKDIAVSMVTDAQVNFPKLKTCSFDKGFHSPDNQKNLRNILNFVVLPKKGRCNKEEYEHENSEDFKSLRKQHSAVESAINALNVHGLKKCPDNGIYGFERYIAVGILARNIQKIGAELRKQEIARLQKKKAA
jgi:hypothetical protein